MLLNALSPFLMWHYSNQMILRITYYHLPTPNLKNLFGQNQQIYNYFTDFEHQ